MLFAEGSSRTGDQALAVSQTDVKVSSCAWSHCGLPRFQRLVLTSLAVADELWNGQLLNFKHPEQGQLKTGSLGKTVWPQLSQIDPFERTVMGRNLPSTTQ
jgi:hypothetical protein